MIHIVAELKELPLPEYMEDVKTTNEVFKHGSHHIHLII